jgi:HAD superfamily hydrolase (TIGR01509 family)
VTPPPPYRAVIFDMDGVLTDSEPAFHAAINDILARYGKHIGLDDGYRHYVGGATPHVWAALIEKFSLPVALADVLAQYEEPLAVRLREPRPPLPGARELIEALRARRVPVGLCTASYAHWVDAVLGSAGLTGLFDAISSADLVERTKPDSAPYELAARMLGLRPDECIVVEDSVSGVTSALRAGACVIQLRATDMAAPPVRGVALVIESLAEFPLDLVAAGSTQG